MSAAELRKAAETLRERAQTASPRPWRPFDHHGRDMTDEGWSEIGVQNDGHTVAITYPTGFENDFPEPDAAYIATMHPGVGLALADWLDTAGTDLWAYGPLCECGSGCHDCDDSLWEPHVRRALAVARLINGGAA